MMDGSVAEFVNDHGSGTAGYIGHDDCSCATASRMIVGRIARLWYHGGARCLHPMSASCAFGLISDMRCPSHVLGLCGGAGQTRTNTAVHRLWPRGAAGVSRRLESETVMRVRTPSAVSTLGACAEPFWPCAVYISVAVSVI